MVLHHPPKCRRHCPQLNVELLFHRFFKAIWRPTEVNIWKPSIRKLLIYTLEPFLVTTCVFPIFSFSWKAIGVTVFPGGGKPYLRNVAFFLGNVDLETSTVENSDSYSQHEEVESSPSATIFMLRLTSSPISFSHIAGQRGICEARQLSLAPQGGAHRISNNREFHPVYLSTWRLLKDYPDYL